MLINPSWEDVLARRSRWAVERVDALELLRRLPDACVDVLHTDPPYSSGGKFRGDRAQGTESKYRNSDSGTVQHEFSGDTRDQRGWAFWCTLWLLEARRVTAAGGLLAVWVDWRQLPALTDAIQAAGWDWRGIAAWDKTQASRPQKGRPRAQCEFVVWATNGPRPLSDELPCVPGFWSIHLRDRNHRAAKPRAIGRDLATLAPRDGLVLDLFAGGGGLLVGALEVGRRVIGCEVVDPIAEACSEALRDAAGESRTMGQQLALDGVTS